MTELNEEQAPEAAQPPPEWPEPRPEDIGDPSVAAIVASLESVKAMPVAGHEAIYGELHDALLESLNEDAPSGNGGS
ncbi:hypothetical protein J7E83_12300 [Arthrobacter sp. ISL-48]|uniref:hypothetical protein n=1 Tax=Arthrobacter sp. ISL-48 TaxID=2819110 RepID=UPI001BEA3211|nr:hypothetical protein [Arthrobacter sp. ISL-48]MBT2532889.1 hypothetical protein [Arthrobacter sp. ISL-48]